MKLSLLALLSLSSIIVAENPIINEGTTEAYIANLKDCSSLSVDLINRVLNPYVCHGFTPACLAQFTITNLNWNCVHQISFKTKNDLYQKSFVELLNTDDPNAVHLLHFKLTRLLCKYGQAWHGLPPLFTSFCARDFRCSEEVMGAAVVSGNYRLLSGFMEPHNIVHFPAVLFHDIESGMIKAIPPESLSKISLEQFRMIEGHVLTNLSAEQIEAIPAAFFRHWGDPELLQYYTVATLNAITIEQLDQFGEDPQELMSAIMKKKPRIDKDGRLKRLKDRRALYDHPCYHLKPLLMRFHRESIRQAIEKRCAPIWKAVGNKFIPVRRDLDVYIED